MPLQEELCFVQFLHPGGEHRPRDGEFMDWNSKTHRRKFVEIAGRCLSGRTFSEGSLCFWAEWEPQSETTPIARPVNNGPRFIHRPYYGILKTFKGLQNTDPFVFGGFFYTGCQQHANGRATQLRYLKRGSVILFGSSVRDQFALDTVFVVKDWVDHDASNFRRCLKSKVPKQYFDVTLAPWFSQNEGANSCGTESSQSWRLYFGATHENPVDGMFSFFP